MAAKNASPLIVGLGKGANLVASDVTAILEQTRDIIFIDEGEIVDMEWTTPAEAIARHHEGEIEIVPPTWVTLDTLRGHSDVDALLRFLRARPARHHATKVAGGDEHPVVMWEGDAGYESADARVEGPRHRLTMRPTGYVYEDDGVDG